MSRTRSERRPPLPPLPPPLSEAELIGRARVLSGNTIGWLGAKCGVPVPVEPLRAKGFVGGLLEAVLGATAGSRAEPDFPHLGIEMKTVPVDRHGVPRESTYVCTAPMDGTAGDDWASSWVRRKLGCVLWMPIITDGGASIADRTIGEPVLWRPSPAQEATLRADWEALTESLGLGELWQVDGRRGAALQLRPKAANAAETTWVLDDEANWVRRNPLGFYLRRGFTREILSGSN